jgi:lysophospholipase L1-like esterase
MTKPIAVRSTRRRLVAAAALIAAAHKPVLAGPKMEIRVRHVVLLGDSIFDNAAYVAGGPDVVHQLRERLPSGWRATLAAVDGSVTASVALQLQQLPPDASHLIVSVGGNDALGHAGTLDEGAQSMAEALDRMAGIRDQFERDYGAMLDSVLERGLPTAVCTIYDARFPDPLRRRLAATGLTIFNDWITREAFSRALPLIDLRLICNEDEDFANPIEPSVRGGAKIAAAAAALLAEHDFARHRSEVFAW